MKLDLPKGTRDIHPDVKILRDSILSRIRKSFETFGFLPIETPTIELFDTLSFKYAGGSEILKETFRLKDQGQRNLGLRYDLTVPLARYIAMNPNIKMPFKRYQIANVFRDGPIKLGRYREFTQCDADTVGTNSLLADAEIIALVSNVFDSLKLSCEIKLNNRKLLNGILEFIGVNKKNFHQVISTIDKLPKINESDIRKELKNKHLNDRMIEELLGILKISGSNEDILIELRNEIANENSNQGIEELEEIFNYLNMMSIRNVKLDISLARGLDYYTSTVIEVFLHDTTIRSSVAAGGRYDDMIASFMNSGKKIPAVGISFGLDVIVDAMSQSETKVKSLTKVYIIPIKTLNKPLELLGKLRSLNVNTDIDLSQRGITKNLNFANRYDIPFVVIIGETELNQNKIRLRNMKSGQEDLLSEPELLKKLIQ